MRKIAWLITIIVIIAAGAVIWGIQTGKLFVGKSEILVSVSSIHQTDNFYNVQVEYPQFKNVSTSFNEKISQLMEGEIATFKENAKANWETRRATATPDNPVPENPEQPFDFIASWEPAQVNGNYLSFVINIYYFVGGAHGANEIHAFNYDAKNQKEITMLDFLNSSQDALNKLATLAAKDVKSQLESNGIPLEGFMSQMVEEGTKPTQENYQNFNFNYNSLTIYFQQYQVAPGSVGSVTVTFYKNTLDSNSIKSDYLK